MGKKILWNDAWTYTMPGKPPVVLTLPHTWNGTDGQDGGNDYKRCRCKYEKDFKRPQLAAGETCLLVFHGVNSECEIVLNGTVIASHEGGYSTFWADMTPHLAKENHLEVLVDNSPNEKVYPQKADFTFYGGIYRDVELEILPADRFVYREDFSPALKIRPEILGENGRAHILLDVAGKGEVTLSICDGTGRAAAEKKISEDELRQLDGHMEETLEIPHVHRWHGIKDPYLYTVKAVLLKDGKAVDETSARIGFRTFRVDAKEGFFLNEQSYPLRGVCRHQDRPGLGNAITKAEHREDMALIKEIGANTVRLAHYQHDQYFYDLCDETGMVVWAEIPYISEHMPGGRENTISQMRELIHQNYNHPCIMTWGLSNEITISTKDKKDMLNNHHVLNDLCHKLDPDRVTTLACYAMCNPFGKVVHISDIVSYNLYLGWYVPGLFLNDIFLKLFHLRYPNRCIGYSEYGAEAMPNLHGEHPHRGDHTEEYQAIYHEYMLKCFERHPFMWATHVWNMYDFAADARDQGGEPGMNHKGLVTFDRKTKKDSFYLYQAYWSEQPMVHICSKRFEERKAAKITVKVYSNQPEVSIYDGNGKLLETKKGEKIFKFRVSLKDGENRFTAVAGAKKDTAVWKRLDNPKSYKLEKKKSKSANWV
jgi:beta-galactosidase